MDANDFRLKRRAAVAAVTSLAIFLLCLAGIQLSRRVRDAALNPRVDVRQFTGRFRQPISHAERQRILNREMPGRGDLLAAVFVGRSENAWAGHKSVVTRLQTYFRPQDLTVYPGGAPSVVVALPGPEWRIVATYPQRERLIELPSEPTPLPTGAPDPMASPPPPMPGIHAPIYAEGILLDPEPTPSSGKPEVDLEQLRTLHPRVQQVLREALWERDWPTPRTEWRSWRLLDDQGEEMGHLLVLPRPKMRTHALATYALGATYAGAGVSLLLYLFMLPWWVYLDARPRTERALPLAIFVGITNFLGWLTYLVIRPEEQRQCPACATLLEPGFRLCPCCGWGAASRCRQCGRPARAEWHFCPYCEAPRPPPDAEISPVPT